MPHPSRPRFPVALFDLDNTLSDFTAAQREALPALLAAHGVPTGTLDATDYLPMFKRLAAPLWDRLEAGTIGLDTLNHERFRLLVEQTDLGSTYGLDPEALAPDYLVCLSRSGRLLPGAIDLLDRLVAVHPRPIRLGLITNGYAEVQRPRLDHFDLVRYFDAAIVSSEIGHAKPGKAFFDLALEAMGNPDPATVLVVGDSLSSDIAGGAAAGCATCWFDPARRGVPHASTFPRVDHVVHDLADIAGVVLGD